MRELNEGVKRIYTDMERFFLDEPVYSEPEESVRLVLKNNIVMRTLRQTDRTEDNIGAEIWSAIDEVEKQLLTYMMSRGPVKRTELIELTGKSAGTIGTRLNHLIRLGVVKANGSTYDPKRTYEIDLSKT